MEEETRIHMVPKKQPPDGWVFGHRQHFVTSGGQHGEHVVWMSPDGSHHVWITSRAVVQRRMVTEWVDDLNQSIAGDWQGWNDRGQP